MTDQQSSEHWSELSHKAPGSKLISNISKEKSKEIPIQAKFQNVTISHESGNTKFGPPLIEFPSEKSLSFVFHSENEPSSIKIHTLKTIHMYNMCQFTSR